MKCAFYVIYVPTYSGARKLLSISSTSAPSSSRAGPERPKLRPSIPLFYMPGCPPCVGCANTIWRRISGSEYDPSSSEHVRASTKNDQFVFNLFPMCEVVLARPHIINPVKQALDPSCLAGFPQPNIPSNTRRKVTKEVDEVSHAD